MSSNRARICFAASPCAHGRLVAVSKKTRRNDIRNAVGDVVVTEGPATIKSENGWLRNYVRLNVRGRNPFIVVEDARRIVGRWIINPPGVFIEWTGQFQQAAETQRMLMVLIPAVLLLIGVGYIACFGMAASTGIVMLVYLRGAVNGSARYFRNSGGE